MPPRRVNCHADFRPQVDIKVPGADGNLGDPGAGVLTTVKCRLSATKFGAAINAAVNDLAGTETATQPYAGVRRFFAPIDKALMEAHVLTLGVGASFHAVWSKAGDFDAESVEYIVSDGTQF